MKTILVVDDDKQNLAAASEVLNGEYRVIPFIRGQQALTYLGNGECDMILLDILMPEMDGFEVLRKMREMERCSSTPVIFLTGENDIDTEIRCFKEGAMDFIAKPFIPEIMLSRVARILELDELRRSLADRVEQQSREISDMRSKSRQDPLTGLWNRLYTEEAINEMLECGTRGALMMMDMDNFKSINDNYGHIAGDRMLQMFADTLRHFFSENDILCRIGGDEFVVFVKGETSKDKLSDCAANIIADLGDKIKQAGFKTRTSISIGIAQIPDDGTQFTQLYNSADKALYHVKQNGKNSYHFFSDKIEDINDRNGRTVDLKYLQELMSSADSDTGAYLLDFESFNHVYNFIRRFINRSKRDVQTLLFTVYMVGSAQPDAAETEYALELLEKAVYTSLRNSDVSTRYSSKQLIVILMDTDDENGDIVAERIIEEFNRHYTGGKVHIVYGIARMEPRAKSSEED